MLAIQTFQNSRECVALLCFQKKRGRGCLREQFPFVSVELSEKTAVTYSSAG